MSVWFILLIFLAVVGIVMLVAGIKKAIRLAQHQKHCLEQIASMPDKELLMRSSILFDELEETYSREKAEEYMMISNEIQKRKQEKATS